MKSLSDFNEYINSVVWLGKVFEPDEEANTCYMPVDAKRVVSVVKRYEHSLIKLGKEV